MQESHPHEVFTSIWPPILGLGITLLIIGIMVHVAVSAVGALITLYSLWGWTQETRRLSALADQHAPAGQHAAEHGSAEEGHEH